MTPLMQQWTEVKNQHLDKVVAFRMGDFFEFFNEDAEAVAPALGIQLTQRNKKSADNTPMCGVPHFSLPDIASRLLAKGFRVAICDQIEDPKFAKGLVKRAVTRILTPGMVYDPLTLKPSESNFMMSFDETEIAFLDSSTGEAFYYSLAAKSNIEGLVKLIQPVEIAISKSEDPKRNEFRQDKLKGFESKIIWLTTKAKPRELLIEYAAQTQGGFKLTTPFEERFWNQRLILSDRAVKHLELTESFNADGVSLFNCIDTTKTAAGARLLKSWMLFPLIDKTKIEDRLDEVESFVSDFELIKKVRVGLAGLNDLQRLLGRLSMSSHQPRDLSLILEALEVGFGIEDLFVQTENKDLLAKLKKIVSDVTQTFERDSSKWSDSYGYIRRGRNAELDELITLTEDAKTRLLELEARLKSETQISTLKIGYNSVFGYYIEVSKANASKVPQSFVRKQTLTNGERYVIDELKELEVLILSSGARRTELEKRILADLRGLILNEVTTISLFARRWAHLDVVTSLAWIAIERGYTRPSLGFDEIVLSQSRHPVVERLTEFKGNDLKIKNGEVMLLTGPNMAGKSTLMRQVALTAIMAQMGSFVPAKKALLPLFDQVFTRIGSSDSLSEGHSTFMVEMLETAELLSKATSKSLVVLDEIGRGTSTFDGLSLAQGLLEYILESVQCITLFATHYHELPPLADRFKNIKNVHMGIAEKAGELQFLYQLNEGPAQKSYGIHVAKLAGLPPKVIARAQEILKALEGQSIDKRGQANPPQLDLELWHQSELAQKQSSEMTEIINKIKKIDPNQCTPLDALRLVYELRQLV